jgi:group I intron endonuclease
VIVYLILNRINGKVYVGKTERRQAPDKALAWRWRTHCRVAERGSSAMLHRAIRKYGAASFSAEVICETADRFTLIELEKKFIAQFRSFPPALGFGYNLTAGGEGLIGFKPTAEQRQRLVMSHLGTGEDNIPKATLEGDIRAGLTIYEMKAKYGLSRNCISANCIRYWGMKLERLRLAWGCRVFRGNQWAKRKSRLSPALSEQNAVCPTGSLLPATSLG